AVPVQRAARRRPLYRLALGGCEFTQCRIAGKLSSRAWIPFKAGQQIEVLVGQGPAQRQRLRDLR
ncbi:MAG: hypothetical protein CFK52_15060, partial [Chloracidobacterium sp. CP2_5A]